MQQDLSVTSTIEHVLFDFTCCVNELHLLQNELSLVDIDQVERSIKLLRDAIQEKQRQRIHTLYAVI